MTRHFADVHADWLRLVEPEGQYLTLPVIRKAFPSGLDSIRTPVRDELRKRYPKTSTPSQEQWDAWIDWLLRSVLEWGPYYRTGDDVASFTHTIAEYGLTLRASGALLKDGAARVMIVRYPHGTFLDQRIKGDRWNTSPVDRVKELCKAHSVRLGLVTDGESIVLVWVPPVGAGGHATWDTSLFLESRERGLLQSFTSLLRASRFFSVQESAQIESLFEASEKLQSEVTSQLGFQVRQAVELLINAISKENLERGGKLLAGIPPKRVYEAAATVMMRLVFLLYAEERDLLPLSEPLYADYYAISTLREQLDEQAAMEGDEPLERRGAAWNRLLAAFRVIYAGLNHDRLRLPPYGGRLFDPDRFPFLEGRTDKQKWTDSTSAPLFVDDLTVRAILEAIQTLPIRVNGSAERRRLSFRSLDVEQIGHVYEGLLDHGAERVEDVYLGLVGKTGDEAEIPLADLEKAAARARNDLVSLLADKTKRSEGAIEKLLLASDLVIEGRDPDMRRLLNTACDNNRDLAKRIAPFVYTLRKDLHGLPVIFNAGSLVVKQTRARRDSGTEYTPRELAEETVQYELEPLVYSPGPGDAADPNKWKLRSAKELLDLKICDPAVGSGAFLVSACRYLADRLVEAWVAEDPQLKNANRDELTLDARRAVVDRCLYGVDRDSMAVEMAKLSLWLITMARERPFSFLDHSIREGDSLLGVTSLDQILNVHMDPTSGKALHDGSIFDVTAVVKPLVDRAAELRGRLEELPSITLRDAEEKNILNYEANHILQDVSLVADSIIAVALSTADQSEKQRNAAYQSAALLIREALDPSIHPTQRADLLEQARANAQSRINAGRATKESPRVTFHWPLAFPEVFNRGKAGFDAMIGNPPFVGGSKISGSFGSDFREFLVQAIAGGRKGNSDLIGYFFLRAADLATSFAFLAVNTIAQGDTRAIALEPLLDEGWAITRAVKSRPWPGVAGVHISQVWLTKRQTKQIRILDNVAVDEISALLSPARKVRGKPVTLHSNTGLAFEGSKVAGFGFVLSIAQAERLFEKDARYREVIWPYLGADDVCSQKDFSPSRYVINFFDWPLERAQEYDECISIIRNLVKPEREKNNRSVYRKKWWQYAERRPNLYRTIRDLRRVIVMPNHSKHVLPVIYSNGIVFSNALTVIARDDYSTFAVLTSTLHRDWARMQGGTLKSHTRYTPTASFETFPFPPQIDTAAQIAEKIDITRRSTMASRAVGLTSLYNLVHDRHCDDADIQVMRALHANLDRAVCKAYGYDELNVECSFHDTDEGLRWTMAESVRSEIQDRLLNLNRDLAARQTPLSKVASAKGKGLDHSANAQPEQVALITLN